MTYNTRNRNNKTEHQQEKRPVLMLMREKSET